MNLPALILASTSPRRSELLRQLRLDFKVLSGRADEIHPEHLTPHEICQVNAYRKARAVAKKCPDALVLGADTIVCLGTKVFGKPKDLQEAHQTLSQLQGRTHEVVTGVCLIHLRNHRQRSFAESTTVTFRHLHSEQIKRYLSKVNPLDKAGAYAIQEQGDELVKQINGSFSNVVGLPIERLRAELEMWDKLITAAALGS
jgi:septum formation protein